MLGFAGRVIFRGGSSMAMGRREGKGGEGGYGLLTG